MMFSTSSYAVQPPGGRPVPVRRRSHLALLVLTLLVLTLLVGLISPFIRPAGTVSAATTAASTSHAASTASLKLAAAAAAGGGAAPVAVTHNTGDFTTSISFQVPAYHGLQPQLGLSYDSLAGNGLVGQGWQLTGFPQIDRTSAERGAPRFDGSDVFQLNGEDLVPNTGLGGQYVTKRQSYLRISYDAGTDTWTLVDKSGTSYTLGPIVKTGPSTNRWLITRATDPHGNTVTYSYWCDSGSGNQCYPDTVSYNGTVVTFYRETRPDVITEAIGGLLTTNYRIKTVEVQVGGAIARVYALSYTTSAATEHSLLTAVTQYGTDATVDANGNVTGGSALSPIKASYQVDGTQSFTPAGANNGLWLSSWCAGASLYLADVDGDGKVDLVCHDGSGNTSVALSNGHSGFVPAGANNGLWLASWCGAGASLYLADVNGDGRADLICRDGAGNVYVALSTGSTFVSAGANNGLWLGGWCYSPFGGMQFFVADVSGDGKTDLICEDARGNFWTALSNGSTAFTLGSNNGLWLSGWCWVTNGVQFYLADVNGDGKADLVCHDRSANTYVALSTGSSFVPAGPSNGLWLSGWCNIIGYRGKIIGQVFMADVNGDGKADLVCRKSWYGTPLIYVALSNGSTAFVQTANGDLWLSGWCATQAYQASIYADNKADLLCNDGAGHIWVALSNGSTAFTPAGPSNGLWLSGWCGGAALYVADVNGDGKPDLVCHDGSGNTSVAFSGSPGSQNDLLTGLTNQYGGTTGVSYVPESVPGGSTTPFTPVSPNQTPELATGSLGVPLPLVTSVTRNAGINWDAPPIVTNYTSSDPAWDPIERRFLGYGTIAATNSSGATATTIFRQVPSYPTNRPAQVSITDASGTLLAYTASTYQENTSGGVYTSLLSKVTQANCAGASLCQASSTTYQYDGYGNLTQQLENGGDDTPGHERLTVNSYHPNTGAYLVGYPAEQTIYAGTTMSGTKLSDTTYTYDGQADATLPPLKGDVTTIGTWLNTANTFLTTTSGYDTTGNVVSTTDALGHTGTISYDSTYHLYPTQVCNALNQCTGQTWDTVLGVQTAQIDQANSGTPTISTAYDVFGRPVKQTLPDGSFTTTAYVNMGTPGQYTQTDTPDGSPTGLWTQTYLDGFGRTYATTQKSTSTVVTLYNAQGQVAAVSAPYFNVNGAVPQYTTYQYDALGRQIVLTHPDGSTQTASYTVALNAADGDFKTARLTRTSCDELKYCIRQAVDGYGQPVIVDELVGGTSYDARTHLNYDVLGNLTGYTDAQGNVASMTYDSLGRKIATSDPDLGHWSYAYDADGNLVSQTDARGVTVNFTYDALNRLLKQTSGAQTLASYTYDEANQPQGVGRLTSMSDPSGSTVFGYDVNGRLIATTKVISGQSFSMSQTYDKAGRLASLTYPDGEVVPYSYDANGCLTSVGKYVTNASCTANGSLGSLTLGNGLTETLSYSATRQWLTKLTVTQGSTSLGGIDTSNRNPRGQLLAQTSDNPALNWTYQYDALGRLTQASSSYNAGWNQAFSYDVLGRVFPGTGGETLTYPAAGHVHAPATHNGTAYTYDANGNRTGGDGHTYTYDALNRLVNVSGTAYLYDGLNHRVQVGNTLFIGIDSQILAEQSGTSRLQYYYYGNMRIAQKDQAGTVMYYLNDHLGTPNLLTGSSGTATALGVYGPYGKPLLRNGISNPFSLAGQRLDPSGLYHMGARYMDPTSATFTSPDPSGASVDPTNPQTLNRYAYANNDPVDVIDPSGYVPTVVDKDRESITITSKDNPLPFLKGNNPPIAVTVGLNGVYATAILQSLPTIPLGPYAKLQGSIGITAGRTGSIVGGYAWYDLVPGVCPECASIRARVDIMSPKMNGVWEAEVTLRAQVSSWADTFLTGKLNLETGQMTWSGPLPTVWNNVTSWWRNCCSMEPPLGTTYRAGPAAASPGVGTVVPRSTGSGQLYNYSCGANGGGAICTGISGLDDESTSGSLEEGVPESGARVGSIEGVTTGLSGEGAGESYSWTGYGEYSLEYYDGCHGVSSDC